MKKYSQYCSLKLQPLNTAALQFCSLSVLQPLTTASYSIFQVVKAEKKFQRLKKSSQYCSLSVLQFLSFSLLRPADMVTPKKETDGGKKGRVKLKADPSILADLGTTFDPPTPSSRTALWGKTPDKGSPKPVTTPGVCVYTTCVYIQRVCLCAYIQRVCIYNVCVCIYTTCVFPTVADSSSSPADWRSKLKPVSKETK